MARKPRRLTKKREYKTLRPKKRAFLLAYAECGNITEASQLCDISRQRHYDWMRKDPEYPALFKAAHEQFCDKLEKEIYRRAVRGTNRPVFYQGRQVGKIREYSDTLLIFRAKGEMPDKYRERTDVSLGGKDGGPIEVNLLDQAKQQLLSRILSVAARRGAAPDDRPGPDE